MLQYVVYIYTMMCGVYVVLWLERQQARSECGGVCCVNVLRCCCSCCCAAVARAALLLLLLVARSGEHC